MTNKIAVCLRDQHQGKEVIFTKGKEYGVFYKGKTEIRGYEVWDTYDDTGRKQEITIKSESQRKHLRTVFKLK